MAQQQATDIMSAEQVGYANGADFATMMTGFATAQDEVPFPDQYQVAITLRVSGHQPTMENHKAYMMGYFDGWMENVA